MWRTSENAFECLLAPDRTGNRAAIKYLEGILYSHTRFANLVQPQRHDHADEIIKCLEQTRAELVFELEEDFIFR